MADDLISADSFAGRTADEFPMPTGRQPTSPGRPVHPNKKNFPALSQSEFAADEAFDRSEGNLAELDSQIARYAGKPKLQGPLLEERERLRGAGPVKVGFKPPVSSSDLVSADFFAGRSNSPRTIEEGLKADRSALGVTKAAGRDVVRNVIGSGLGLVDMFAGLAGMAVGTGAYIGTRAFAAGAGESNEAGAKAAAVSAEHLTPDALAAPYRKIMEHFGVADTYDESTVARIMHWVAKGIEKGSNTLSKETGGLIRPEDYQALANGAMLYFGAKGSSAALRNAAQGRLNTKAEAAGRASEMERVKELVRPIDEVAERGRELPPAPEPVDALDFTPEREGVSKGRVATGVGVGSAIGAKIALGEEDDATNAALAGGAALAVKGKGGMWHPEAVERLARPLEEKIGNQAMFAEPINHIDGPEALRKNLEDVRAKNAARTALNAWPARKIREYLNKHAGTATDPLSGYVGVDTLKAEKAKLQEAITAHEKTVKPTLESMQRPGDEPGKTAARLERKLAEYQEAVEAAQERRERIAQIDTALKDVKDGVAHDVGIEIPFGEGVKRWEEVTDGALTSAPRERSAGWDPHNPEANILSQAKPGETVWDLGETGWEHTGQPSKSALTSYLSHVGDYLREHVPAEKLPQYDLVRAVKETAAWDKELARKMDKARQAEKGDSPIYKDYGDGMYWQQLTKPGQFARESDAMGHSVRGYEPPKPEARQLSAMGWKFDQIGFHEGAYALETARRAWKKLDPKVREEQRLAVEASSEYKDYVKRINESGPQGDWVEASGDSGHPGYGLGGWEAIKRGDAKVYSLRDAKGKSHATVEVAAEIPERPFESVGSPGDTGAQARITQIKGPQNRAPSAAYLPYVQDFVKGRKWGEVGDIHNADMVHGREITGHTNAEGLKLNHDELRHAGVDPNGIYTHKEIGELANKYHDRFKSQRGSADPATLAKLAAVGVGAVAGASLDPEHPFRGAALGALGGAVIAGLRRGGLLEKAVGVISTTIRHESEAIRMRAIRFEKDNLKAKAQAHDVVAPFLQEMGKLKGEAAKQFNLALLSGEPISIKGNPKLAAAYAKVQGLLSHFEAEQKKLGRFAEGLTNYFPRLVTDLPGLKKAIGASERKGLDRVLANAEAEMARKESREMTDVEKSLVINRYLMAQAPNSHLPGFAHGRRIKEVTEKLAPYYASPKDSLLRYITGATEDIQTAKFFGKDLATKMKGKKAFTDIDASIGNVLLNEAKAGRLTDEGVKAIRGALKNRFEGGEKSMGGFLQDVRNLTNIGLLGSWHAAGTQIGDSVAVFLYHQGMRATTEALLQRLAGRKQVSAKEFGLVNHIAEELGSQRLSGKWLQNTFKLSGFSAIDRFAKELNLNAGLIKNQRLAQSKSGRALLQEKYGDAFGDEFPKLLEDLKARRRTDNVDTLLFSELSDAQPVTKLEMTHGYNAAPNLRLFYQMKTYMIKQLDIVRRDSYDNIRKGLAENKPQLVKEGLKNLMKISLALSLSNIPGDVVKDWLSGRSFDFKKIDYVESLLKNFGLNRYASGEIKKGNAPEVVRDMVVPPFKHYKELGKMDEKVIKYIPGPGRAIYDRAYGGNEAKEKSDRKYERMQNPSPREAIQRSRAVRQTLTRLPRG